MLPLIYLVFERLGAFRPLNWRIDLRDSYKVALSILRRLRRAGLIPILDSKAWLEFRGTPENGGQNMTTHLALIQAPSGQEYKCYVKASPIGSPMVFTEAAGWIVAEALDLPRPKFAALVSLPVAKLRTQMKLDQHWVHYPEVLAFCSSAVDGKHLTGRWKWFAQMRVLKALKHLDVTRIAAFDQWVENQDRHTGNLLRTASGGYVPIDNEAILYSLIWKAAGTKFEPRSLTAQANSMLKHGAYMKFEASMIVSSQDHAQAFEKAWPNLLQLVNALTADPAQAKTLAGALMQFLGSRAQPNWLPEKLGHIT